MEDQPKVVEKRERSDAQKEALAKAREKAAVVRAENAQLRRTQAEADRLAAEEVKRQRVQQAERELKAMQEPPPGPNPEAEAESEQEEEEVVEYVKRKRPTKRRKVIVEEQSSDEEITLQLPKKRMPAVDDTYGATYAKMFSI